MTDTAPLDCPAIAKFDDDHIFSTVQNVLFPRVGWKANMTTKELFVFAWACYNGGRVDTTMTIARGEGDHARWVSDRVLPCYMGSWYLESLK
jgi:hypothetical protein